MNWNFSVQIPFNFLAGIEGIPAFDDHLKSLSKTFTQVVPIYPTSFVAVFSKHVFLSSSSTQNFPCSYIVLASAVLLREKAEGGGGLEHCVWQWFQSVTGVTCST